MFPTFQVGNFSVPLDRALWDKSDMASPGDLQGMALYEALMRLKPEGLTETDWASAAGVNRGFFSNLKGKVKSPRMDTVRKLLDHVGRTDADLRAAPGELPPPNAKPFHFEGDGLEQPEENLPVWGSGLGASRLFEGEAIEQTDLNSGETLEWVRRPAVLKGKKGVYGLHVQGGSMHPALPDGELVIAARDMPLSVGDNVVVYLKAADEGYYGERVRGVLVKELVRRSASFVRLRQYDPDRIFDVPMVEVLRIDRILTRREMLS